METMEKRAETTTEYQMTAVGFELADECSQMSFFVPGMEQIQSVSIKTGEERYQIPTAVFKKKGGSQWLFGEEAIREAKKQDGYLLTNLVSLYVQKEYVEIEGEVFETGQILMLFLKKALHLLGRSCPGGKIGTVCFTVLQPEKRLADFLRELPKTISVIQGPVLVQDYEESLYHYIIRQEKDIWLYQVLLFWQQREALKVSRLEFDRRMRPMVASVSTVTEDAGFFEKKEPSLEDKKNMDAVFAEIAARNMKQSRISCVYLNGDGFYGEWMKESLEVLCDESRVFQGKNLYTRGACYRAMKEEGMLSEDTTVFLGKEHIRYHIGLKLRDGENGENEAIEWLVQAGTPWYEAEGEWEFLLDNTDRLTFVMRGLSGVQKEIVMELSDLPARPEKTTRLRMAAAFLDEKKWSVKVYDLGFGEIYPSTGKKWSGEWILGGVQE